MIVRNLMARPVINAEKNHHCSLHTEKLEIFNSSLIPNVIPCHSQFQEVPTISNSNNIQRKAAYQKREIKPFIGLCSVQKVKVMDRSGNLIETLTMLYSGSNTSLLLITAARRLSLNGSATHPTMNLAGRETKSKSSEFIEIAVAAPKEEDFIRTLQVFTVKRPCSNAKTVSKESVEHYAHLKNVLDKLLLSGGVIGCSSSILTLLKLLLMSTVDVRRTGRAHGKTKLLWIVHARTGTVLEENRTPRKSTYYIALKRMQSTEKSFLRKDCFKVVDEEVQKALDQG